MPIKLKNHIKEYPENISVNFAKLEDFNNLLEYQIKKNHEEHEEDLSKIVNKLDLLDEVNSEVLSIKKIISECSGSTHCKLNDQKQPQTKVQIAGEVVNKIGNLLNAIIIFCIVIPICIKAGLDPAKIFALVKTILVAGS